jgi:hypothetical protein
MKNLAASNKLQIVHYEKISITTQIYKHFSTAFLSETAFDILYEDDSDSSNRGFQDFALSHKLAITTNSNISRAFGRVQKPGIDIISIEFSHKIDGCIIEPHGFLKEYDDCFLYLTACSEDSEDELCHGLMSVRHLLMIQGEDAIEEIGFEAWWSKIHTNY